MRAAGGRVRCGVSARLGDEGELWLRDGDGERLVRCEAVMAAPGAWARELLPLPAQPLRRHLFVSEDDGGLPSGAPWVWDLDEELYFRREGAGLLLSACDEEPLRCVPTGRPAVDAGEVERLAEGLAGRWPGLSELRVATSWAGLRTLTPDDGFILGADPRRSDLFWCAGLGGHGVTCAIPASALAVEALLERLRPGQGPLLPEDPFPSAHGDLDRLRAAHSPKRFATLTESWDA